MDSNREDEPKASAGESNPKVSRKPEPKLWEKLKPEARRMRHQPAHAETLLWQHLRSRQLEGLKFRRQHAFSRFIVDFYCPSANLVIELDGGIHQFTTEEDEDRQKHLELLGLKVIRFSNEEVIDHIDLVLSKIKASAKA